MRTDRRQSRPSGEPRRILRQGVNCGRIEQAAHAAFLIDAENYFLALRKALLAARHCVFIIGWDIHSELALVRDRPEDGHPRQLGALLDAVAAAHPDLHVHILNWDFAMIYALEREFFPSYRLQWKSHDRVHFCLDGNHPAGASQHQKLVVIDDAIAFCGGIDLSKWRWDTRAHTVDDDRRRDPGGDHYPPFHDVQMMVDGAAAAALGEIARQRWSDALGREAAKPDQSRGGNPWPASIRPDLEAAELAIALTRPGWNGSAAVREVERLYLDSIAAAGQFIYIENQYLSSHRIGQALAERLREPRGPEIVIVMPRETGGWLEQHTMDVLRARLLRDLRDADGDGRLRVYCARLRQAPATYLMIHAKLMIVDDRFVRVGSSNLSNRSMGLDSECDLAAEWDEPRAAVTALRQDLLAEHLGVPADRYAQAEREEGALIAAIESLAGKERTLEALKTELPREVDEWVPDSALIDPEKPIEPEQLFDYIVGADQRGDAWRHARGIGLLLLAIIALAAAWRWTSLSEWLSLDRLSAVATWIERSPLTPLLAVSAFVVGGLLVLPLTLMIVAAVTVFGPWMGIVYALAGAELSALVSFGLGHLLGRDAIGRIAGSRLNAISRLVSRRGVLTIVTLRIVPVAPFTVVNVIAGVSKIRWRDFALGTLIGLVPGVMAIALLADSLVAALREPGAATAGILLLAAIAVGIGLYLLRRWLNSRGPDSTGD